MTSPTPILEAAHVASPIDRAALHEQLQQLCRTSNRELPKSQPSGFAQLDAYLPGGGWPVGALTECLINAIGIGELSLWMPAISAIARSNRYIAFISPPCIPYAPALAQHNIPLKQVLLVTCAKAEDSLWAAEQTLRCAAFGAVFAWPAKVNDRQLRRLQLAAEEGQSIGVLYRPLMVASSPSPAALRLKLQATSSANGMDIFIHKCRGGLNGATVRCELNRAASIAQ